MHPDDAGLQHLPALQDSLPATTSGRPVPARQLHLTLLHFGKAHDVYAAISRQTDIDYAAYERYLQHYIAAGRACMPTQVQRLQPKHFSLFGLHGSTLVIEYQPTELLLAAHASLYQLLREFLHDCRITDVDGFIAADPNFQHVPIFRPHVAIYKGYTGIVPSTALQPISLASGPVVYPPTP